MTPCFHLPQGFPGPKRLDLPWGMLMLGPGESWPRLPKAPDSMQQNLHYSLFLLCTAQQASTVLGATVVHYMCRAWCRGMCIPMSVGLQTFFLVTPVLLHRGVVNTPGGKATKQKWLNIAGEHICWPTLGLQCSGQKANSTVSENQCLMSEAEASRYC